MKMKIFFFKILSEAKQASGRGRKALHVVRMKPWVKEAHAAAFSWHCYGKVADSPTCIQMLNALKVWKHRPRQ